MTEAEKCRILELMDKEYGYKRIAAELNMPLSTVKSFCKRSKEKTVLNERPKNGEYCPNCGKPLVQSGGKPKKFCSDECRNKWWNRHLYLVEKKAVYEFTCQGCGKRFASYGNSRRKYCSHECYIKARFGKAVTK